MKFILSIFFSAHLLVMFSQDFNNKIDCIDLIKTKDVSRLWIGDRINIDDTVTLERSEPLGFIGDNFQRFYIHFNSVIKNNKLNTEYLVYGKTRVKDNVCEFQGKIEITEAFTYYFTEISNLKQGYISGTYEFLENPSEKGSGVLKGKFSTNFFIDSQGQVQYNALLFDADGYENNQFEGIWTSYTSGKIKKCNWGDYRIPNSADLDGGAGEFAPTLQYVKNGWENYQKAWFYDLTNSETKEARLREEEKWWLDK